MLALVKWNSRARQTRPITPPEPKPEDERSSKVIDLVSLLLHSVGKQACKRARQPAAHVPACNCITKMH